MAPVISGDVDRASVALQWQSVVRKVDGGAHHYYELDDDEVHVYCV